MGDWGAIEKQKKWGSGTKPAPNTGSKRSVVWGLDDKAQELVAQQLAKRALTHEPRYIMNAGDNFYWAGIGGNGGRERCGEKSMNLTLLDWFSPYAENNRMFHNVFDNMYTGTALEGKPWLGVLGNHDWGGFVMNDAWDQQIWYTWGPSGRWVMPSIYWHQHVKYPTKNFTVDWYMLESNWQDAKPFHEDPMHNICGSNNRPHNSCKSIGGPVDPYSCHQWFADLWQEQMAWLEDHLNKSTADWQIIVTHFPPDPWFAYKDYRRLTKTYGIDLIVGSHRHDTEMWDANSYNAKAAPGCAYVVVGGGGGVTSEQNPGANSQYGFIDMLLTNDTLELKLINQWGQIRRSMEVKQKHRHVPDSCKLHGCGPFVSGRDCQCVDTCKKYGNCCVDKEDVCPTTTPEPSSCKKMGCNGKFARLESCQCTDDCEHYRNCCYDYAVECIPTTTVAPIYGNETLVGEVDQPDFDIDTTTRPL